MSAKPIRFKEPPAALAASFRHGSFEIFWGLVEEAGNLLVAVWRRAGTGLEFEPVSASFIQEFVKPKTGNVGCRLPETDEDLNQALSALQAA